jgi:hypothetical protein
MRMILLFTALPLFLGACSGGAQVPAPPSAVQQQPGPYEALASEYSAADMSYQKQLKEGRTASELRQPALDFYPRFEALAAKGEGHALLWMASHARAGLPRSNPRRRRARSLGPLRARRPRAGRGALVRRVRPRRGARSTSSTAPPRSTRWSTRSSPAASSPRSRPSCSSARRPRRGAPKNDARAKALTERLQKEFAATAYGRRASDNAAAGPGGTGLNIGQSAPDFTTKDADGVEFKLSDYRGKVVVLDFWGFW